MADNNDYRLSVKLNEHFRENIKLSFVWESLLTAGGSVIIVTNDDKVYQFQKNGLKAIQYLVIFIGNDNEKIKSIIEKQMVKELCYKQLIDFKNSVYHIIARTSDGKVYCWGRNEGGVLGNGKRDSNVYKPELNQYLRGKQIIDFCCGSSHTIVLTISGEVYSWGENYWGQIGIGSDDEEVLVPQQLNGFNEEKVKAISCGCWHSLALTDGGHVFSWGYNECKQLGVSSDLLLTKILDNHTKEYSNKPIPIEMKDKDNKEIIIEKISSGFTHNLVLSREGDIYVFGDNEWGQLGTGDKETQIIPKKLNIKEKFTDISSHSHYNISIALSVNGLYYIWGQCGEELINEPKAIQFKSSDHIFEHYLKINYRAIEKSVIAFKMEVKEENRLFIKLNEYFGENIKLSFVWESFFSGSVIIVTNDDKVYEFKRKGLQAIQYSGILIGNNKKKIEEIISGQMVKELCCDTIKKQLIDFKNGECHIIARTSDGKVYCWGRNIYGVLGNGKSDLNVYKPELNKYLSEKQIIDICCGWAHTVVLTNSGEVYSWGENNWGQIGIGSIDAVVSVPQQLNGFNGEKVKAISCGFWHSLALTESGRVFSWGANEGKQLGVFSDLLLTKILDNHTKEYSNKPIHIEMKDKDNKEIIIEKISSGFTHNLFLSREGDIYVFGNNSDGRLGTGDKETPITPKKLNIKNEKFTDISSNYRYNISIALSKNGLYYIWGKYGEVITEPKEIQFKSFDEIFECFLKINYRAIEKRVIVFDYRFVRNGKYVNDFNQIEELGKGNCGQVFKVQERNSFRDEGEFYAIKILKKVIYNERDFLNELQTSPIVYRLANENVIKYYDLWLEKNKDNYILYIQMELCDKSLNYFIKEIFYYSNDDKTVKKIDPNLIKIDQNNLKDKMLTKLGYYIASEIFVQILNGMNYLHKHEPPIIHGDLHTGNIMLKIEDNKSFVKIADFGRAKLHELNKKNTEVEPEVESERADRSHTSDFPVPQPDINGQLNWAVEHFISRDTISDIYSLVNVLRQLFFLHGSRDYQDDGIISTKYRNLSDFCKKMNEKDLNDKSQTIEETFNEKDLWLLSSEEFNAKNELQIVLKQNNNNSIVYKLIEHLLNRNK